MYVSPPRQCVHFGWSQILRKHQHRQLNDSAQHISVGVFLLLARFAQMHCSRDLGRSVRILATGFDDQCTAVADLSVCTIKWLKVGTRTVDTERHDRRHREAFVVFLGASRSVRFLGDTLFGLYYAGVEL